MKIKYFICAVAMLTGSLQAIGQTYSGAFHCSAPLDGAARPEVNVTAELVIRKGFAQLRRGNENYEELSEGRVVGTSLSLEGKGQFFDQKLPWTVSFRGNLANNNFQAKGEMYNGKGVKTRNCDLSLTATQNPPQVGQATQAVPKTEPAQAAKQPVAQVAAQSVIEAPVQTTTQAAPAKPVQLAQSVQPVRPALTTVISEVAAVGAALNPNRANQIQTGASGLLALAGQPQGDRALGAGAGGATKASDLVLNAGATPTPDSDNGKPVAYATREQMVKATRAGQLAESGNASVADKRELVRSVQRILVKDYGSTPISPDCFPLFEADVTGLHRRITLVNTQTLNNQPPEFTAVFSSTREYVQEIEEKLESLRNPKSGGLPHCDKNAMGKPVPHPYKAALITYFKDYAKETMTYVTEEKARRVAKYQVALAAQQEAERQRIAAEKAARQKLRDADEARQEVERQRIAADKAARQQTLDVEHDRIKQKEIEREKKEKSRVAG